MSVLLGGLALASGLGLLLWIWSLASQQQGPLVLALFSFSIPWADIVALPAPGPLASPSTIFVMLSVAVMALGIAIRPEVRRTPDRRFVPFALLAGLALASAVWSESPLTTIEEVALLLASMATFFVVCGHRFSAPGLEVFEIGTVLGGASASAVAFAQSQLGILSVGKSGIPRFETVGGDPNATAASLLLPFAVGFGKAIDTDLPRQQRWAWGSGAALCVLGIYLTVSRGALIAVAAAVLAVLASEKRWLTLLRIGVTGVAAAVLLLVSAPGVVGDKLLNTSSTGRTQIWRLGLAICRRECDIGSGFGTFPELYREEFLANPTAGGFQSDAFKAHNTPIQLAVEIGLLGLGLYLAGVVMILALALRLPRRSRPAALAATVGWIVTSNLITNINFKYYWLVPAYVVAAASAGSAIERSRSARNEPTNQRDNELQTSGPEASTRRLVRT